MTIVEIIKFNNNKFKNCAYCFEGTDEKRQKLYVNLVENQIEINKI